MEVWNGIWKKILVWNERFLVWNGNGMEENCQYGIWKNRLPFYAMPCRSVLSFVYTIVEAAFERPLENFDRPFWFLKSP